MKALFDDRVEEAAKEVEPLGFLDFAITIGIEAGEELVDLGFTLGGVGIIGKTGSSGSELLDFGSVDLTISVDVELVESLFGGSKSSCSGGGDVCLIFGTEVLHFQVDKG